MLGDLPRDSWHVGRFPYEDVPISEQEVDELVLLSIREPATDPNGSVGVVGVDLHRLGVFYGSEGSKWLLSRAGFGCNLGHGGLDGSELQASSHGRRDVKVFLLVGVRLVQVAIHGDGPSRARKFELKISVVRDGHEPCVAWSAQNGVVGAWEVRYLEDECFRVEVCLSSKRDGQVNLLERRGSYSRHDPEMGALAGRITALWQAHGIVRPHIVRSHCPSAL